MVIGDEQKMEQVIRNKIRQFIKRCIKFEKEVLLENGEIKEEYHETIIDKYLDFFTEFENDISVEDFEICVENAAEDIKKYYIAYYLLDERLYKQLNSELGNTSGWKTEARIRLYMMYLKIFREILFILSSGYSDCALARTRTLYEFGVYISIINKNSDDLAERFCKYCNIQRLKMAEVILAEDRTKEIQKAIGQFNYEEGYKKENGWARILFPKIKEKTKVTFHDLVHLTTYKEYESLYKMSCNFVHGNLFSSLESLDCAKEQRGKNLWNTSPTNEGVEEVIYYLKIYIVEFILEYINSLGEEAMILENMLILFLCGKDALENDVSTI